jgi:ABC-2 type transport system ATP-binding protein
MAVPVEDGLVVSGLVKSYGRLRALDHVDLSVKPGEFVALLGPNGAGKTTLFQLLTGLFVAEEGAIRIDGFDLSKDPVGALRLIGIVFQQQTLDLDLSVTSTLRFHARLQGMRRSNMPERIHAELARLGLQERAKDLVHTLSGGNRRRLELARALLPEPSYLLMDEPTVGLDALSRRDLLAYVLRLREERRIGVLWATHLVDEAEAADRVIVLHRGKIVKEGAPARLVRDMGQASLSEAFLALTGRGEEPPVGPGEQPQGVET